MAPFSLCRTLHLTRSRRAMDNSRSLCREPFGTPLKCWLGLLPTMCLLLINDTLPHVCRQRSSGPVTLSCITQLQTGSGEPRREQRMPFIPFFMSASQMASYYLHSALLLPKVILKLFLPGKLTENTFSFTATTWGIVTGERRGMNEPIGSWG